jgi:hypothetical protein
MQITAIELAGTPRQTTRDGQGIARAFARIERKPGSEYAEIEFILPGGSRKLLVSAKADADERLDAACQLIDTLEGGGTNSMTYDYIGLLDRMLD